MCMRFTFILILFFLLQACSTTKYSIDSYKKLTSDLQKTYKTKRADLILSYDLAEIDNTSCIFSKDLGLFANDKIYAQKYLQKFKEKYRSNTPFGKEANLKVQKITTLLTKLQNKYKILTKKHYQNVKRIAKADFNKIDSKAELDKLDQITSNLPLMLPSYNSYISSNYGMRKHPGNKKYKMHCGIDLVANYHAPIYASATGKVSFVGHQNGYGTTVEISHKNNIKTKYTHLKKAFVKKGQKVIRSQAIALQGRSGNAHGDHLHFEIHIAEKYVNPYDFIGHNYECFKR